MPVTAKLKYLRVAPRKARLVADLIRKKKVEEAQTILTFATKKTAKPLLKLLKTAITDARNNFQLEPDNLYISKITVDEGPKYKRWRPRSRGMAYEIQKKTSHLTLVLDKITPGPAVEKSHYRAGKKVKKVKKVKEELKEPEVKKEEVKKPQKPQKEKFQPLKFRKSGTWEGKPKTASGIKRIFRRKAF